MTEVSTDSWTPERKKKAPPLHQSGPHAVVHRDTEYCRGRTRPDPSVSPCKGIALLSQTMGGSASSRQDDAPVSSRCVVPSCREQLTRSFSAPAHQQGAAAG